MTDTVIVDVTETTLVVEPIQNTIVVEPTVTNLEVTHNVIDLTVEPIIPTITVSASGPQGPQGPPGINNVFYTHVQGSPSITWVINHNLDGYPTAVVFDSANSQCEGTFSYQNSNQMTITFTAPFSGTAYII